MKLHKNSNGFSITGILIILIMAGFIGSTGWYVYSKNQDEKKDKTNVPTTSTSSGAKEDEPKVEQKLSKNWLLRGSNEASISVPDGFEILTNQESEFNFWLPDVPRGTLKYQEGILAKIVGEPHKHFELGLITAFNSQGWNERGVETRQLKTYSGLDVKVRQFEQTQEPDGLDFAKDTKLIQYKVIKGDKYLSIDYAYLDEGIVDIVEEMVRTANIN